MTSISIPEDAVSAIVSKAILESIGAEQRDLVIQQAVKYLITAPPKSHYGDAPTKTPVQQAFEMAASRAMHDAMDEVLAESHDFRALVKTAITEQVRILLDQSYDLQKAVTEALVAVMVKREQDWQYRS